MDSMFKAKSYSNKVIVIEDDHDINELIAYNLRKEGFQVEQVYDGLRASERLSREDYGTVVLDIMLPGLNGFELCRGIKNRKDAFNTLVIIISAKNSSEDKIYAHLIGADCYISKPFNVKTLLEITKELNAIRNREFTVKVK